MTTMTSNRWMTRSAWIVLVFLLSLLLVWLTDGMALFRQILSVAVLSWLPSYRDAVAPSLWFTSVGATIAGIICIAVTRLQRRDYQSGVQLSEKLFQLNRLVTEANQQLQDQEERFRTSVETMLDCFGVYSAIRDASGRILDFRIDYVNDAACINNQLTREEQIGKGLCEILPGHWECGLFEEYCQVVETGQPLVKDALFYEDIYGQRRLTRAFDIRVAKFGDGFVATWRDVSDRKHAEEALRKREEELRLVTSAVPAIISFIDTEQRFRYINRVGEEWFGLRAADIIGKPLWEVLATSTYEQVRPYIKQVLSGQQVTFENQIPRQDGGMRYVSVTYTPRMNSQGIVEGFVALVNDISDRKGTEAALEQSEAIARARAKELETFMETVPAAVWIARDPQCHQVTANRTAYELTRKSPGSVVTATPADGKYPFEFKIQKNGQDIPPSELPMQQAARTGQEVEAEFEFVFSDNEVRSLYGKAVPLRDDSGEIQGAIGAFVDVTERQQVEQALRQKQEWLDLAQAAAKLGSFDCNMQTNVNIWSKELEAIYGLEPGEFGRTYEDWVRLVHPEDIAKVEAELRHLVTLRSDEFFTDFRIIWRDGSIRWIHMRARILYDDDGKALRVVGVNADITDRKQAEEALRRSEARLRRIVDSNIIGIFFGDLNGKITEANDAFLQMLGYTQQDLLAGQICWDTLTPPEYVERNQQAVEALRATGTYASLEKEFFRKDGSRVWVEMGGTLFEGENEGVCYVIDLTERKQAEKALRQSEARLRRLLDSNLIGVVFSDFDGNILDANDAFLQMVGYSRQELSEMDWRTMTPSEYANLDERAIAELQSSGACTPFEKEYFRKDGSRVPILIGFALLEGTENECICFVLDLTQRKQNEEALRQSQERLHLALEAARMGDWDWNIQTGQVHWSANLEKLFGFVPGTFDGRYETVIGMIHPEDRPFVLQAINRAVYEREDYNIEFRFVKPDGEIRWAVGKGRVFYDQMGNPVQMTGVDLDITDRQQAEAALRQSELMFRTLADAMPQMFWVTQPDGYHEYYNQRWYDYTGTTLLQTRGEGWQNILHPDDVQRTIEIWQNSLRTGTTYDIEYRLRRAADGEYRWHLGRAFPLRDPDGEIVKWFGSCTDIHDQKLAIEERAQALERERAARIELEKASRMKDEFLAIVSHELRSPLNGILGWSRLLRTRRLPPDKTEQALASIERNAQAQTQLIEDLLDISRIIRGNIRLNLRPTDLIPIIHAALDTVRPTASTKSIQIEAQLAPIVGLVSGDPDRIQQIVWNLLSNAVKFTPEGGRVEIRLEQVDSRAQIQVIDTGKGIDPDFLPYVFDRFRQADATTTRTQGGLGLGLAIVRNLIELHGGKASVASQGEGKGATFTVQLPLLPVIPSISELEELSVQRQTDWETTLNLNGLKILAVDDEADTREFLKTALEQFGASVTVAASSHETFQLLQTVKPDVLLSDIGMPGEDGYTLIRRVRSLPPEEGGQIPAVALTAYAREDDRLHALAAGFQMHIPKPIEPIQLLVVIDRLARRQSAI